jgi:hypothetical protein
MRQKILSPEFRFSSDIQWVWNDYHNRLPRSSSITQLPISQNKEEEGVFDASIVGLEDFAGCHRSGWQFVLQHLMPYHQVGHGLIFDNYLDRTFHWGHDLYQHVGIIPFQKRWVGVIHHATNMAYTDYNMQNMIANPLFKESLPSCVALIVLSHSAAENLSTLLETLNLDFVVPVLALKHPTDLHVPVFSMQRFTDNPKPMVVQVGGWYRNPYGIYELAPVPPQSDKLKRIQLKKAALKGKNMSINFPDSAMSIHVRTAKQMLATKDLDSPFELTPTTNKFIAGMLTNIEENIDSVEIISTLNNDAYDELLIKNIVFLNLVDASAVNTVLECIARCTPLLVNRLPAIEEYLGANYPFFYDTLAEANTKCSDLEQIQNAHDHLAAMYKDDLNVHEFVSRLVESLTDLSHL